MRKVIAVMLLIVGCSNEPTDLRTHSNEPTNSRDDIDFNVFNGAFDSTSKYQYSIAIGTAASGGGVEPFCSGVLIGPRLALTAAHCMFGDESLTDLRVTNANRARESIGNVRRITRASVPSDFIEIPRVLGIHATDIALIELDSPIVLDKYPIVSDSVEFTSTQSGLPSDYLTVALPGYGNDGTGNRNAQRNIAFVNALKAPPTSNGLVLPKDLGVYYFKPGTNGQNGCAGDSGAGLLKTTNGANPRVVGLVQGGDGKCGKGNHMFGTSTARNKDFINSTILEWSQGTSGSSAWQNKLAANDVNRDGFISPLDALIVINFINLFGITTLDAAKHGLPPTQMYVDVNGDGMIGPIDALLVINFINLKGVVALTGDNLSNLTYSAKASQLVDEYQKPDQGQYSQILGSLATKADQDLGLDIDRSMVTNSGLRKEKWFSGKNAAKYFMTPNGHLYRLENKLPGRASGPLVAILDSSYYANPNLLASAVQPLLTTHKVFVTSETFTGNLGGLAGADAICARLGGAGYLALLSTSTVNAKDRIKISGQVFDTAGNKIAESSADFWDGNIARAIDKDQGGNKVSTSIVFTGTIATGTKSTGHCGNWTVANAGINGAAEAGRTDRSDTGWIGIYGSSPSHACSNASRLYCIK